MKKEDVETRIKEIIKEKVSRHKSEIIALENTEDQVQLLLAISPESKISELVKEIKGSSSYCINQKSGGNLYWQDGYGILSVSKSGLDVVKRYVQNQKEHHIKDNNLIKILEKYTSK